MQAVGPDLPPDEDARLAVMDRFSLSDAGREPAFDHLADLVADVTGCPIALVNLLGPKVQNTIGAHGLDLHHLPRDISFCTRTLLCDPPFVVPDAKSDALFWRNELVIGPPFIRYYAGVPLRLGGHRVGALCLIDTEPRKLDTVALRRLHHFAELAECLLVNRRAEGPGASG